MLQMLQMLRSQLGRTTATAGYPPVCVSVCTIKVALRVTFWSKFWLNKYRSPWICQFLIKNYFWVGLMIYSVFSTKPNVAEAVVGYARDPNCGIKRDWEGTSEQVVEHKAGGRELTEGPPQTSPTFIFWDTPRFKCSSKWGPEKPDSVASKATKQTTPCPASGRLRVIGQLWLVQFIPTLDI